MDGLTIKRLLSRQPCFWGCFARDTLPTFEGKNPKLIVRRACKRGGAKYVSLVCNTDRHTGKGIHWVAILISSDGKTCYLFNSLGGFPADAPEIASFCSQFEQCFYNVKGHQKRNEITCGIYAMYFVTEMNRRGRTFAKLVEAFERKISNDDAFVRSWLEREHGMSLPPP